MTIISLVGYFLAKKAITEEELVHLQAIAGIQKQRVEGMIDRNKERLDLITSRIPMRVAMLEFMKTGDRKQQELVLAAISGAKEAVNEIKKVYILSLAGKVAASTDRAMHGADLSGMEYFIRGKGGYSLDIFSSDAKRGITNYISAPIYHEGKAIGVMVGELAFESMASITNDYTGLGKTGESLLVKRDKDGDALYIVPLRFDQQAALKRKMSRHNTHVSTTQALLKNERASTDEIDYRGKPVLAVTRYIRETDWGLVVKVDKDEAYAPLVKLRYLTITFAVVTLVLVLALALYTARSFTAPLLGLTSAARRISEGDLSVRAAVASKDEIGALERYFNKMTEGLITASLSLNEAQRIAHVGSWELDIVNNRLTWSDEIYRIFEIDPEKFGASYEAFLDIIHPEDRERVDLAYTNSLKTRSPYAIEHRLLFQDGRVKYVHEQCETSYDSDGKPLRSVGTVQDITERKKAEEELRMYREHLEILVKERTAQLESANKELEAFSYSVSHDLRAPLRALTGFSEMLAKRAAGTLDEKNQHYLNVITESAKQMGRLIDDLLSFSRMGRSEMMKQVVSIDRLVKETVKELEADVKQKDIAWEIGQMTDVYGDPSMLRLVVVNLVSNALKFTRTRPRAKIEIGSIPDGQDEISFYVKDNGVGFDMQYAGKLFGIFQRLHRQDEFEGTGIGLANVKRIVARHGGRVWAEGKVDEGATFYFTLPNKTA